MNTDDASINSANKALASGIPSSVDARVSSYRCRPYFFERVVGLVLLLIALPVIGFCVLLVRLTSTGPGLYWQRRVGRLRRPFNMVKIRTMRIDAERRTGPQWTRVNDPRITKLGRLLRASHMDELPQLWNVACGHMALMGPRPERPELVRLLAEHIPGYLDRLSVQPGINGLAQINLPPDTDLESVRQKLILDLEYIATATLWMDIKIVCWSALRLAGCNASVATRLMRLNRRVPRSPVLASEKPLTIEAILEESRIMEESEDESARCDHQSLDWDPAVAVTWQRSPAQS